jgi:phenylpropionate dioxygenase-like ring-hydroxylating dioxygenase large terminal subunit
MIRQHYWMPAVPSFKLEADGAPVRVRLLGKNYIAFRATNGDVGVLDEQCPHRKASLALGRNEDNGIRCIYHGWKFNVKGEVVEAPNHAGNQEQFCQHVRVNRYTAVDRGGIVWVWLGTGDTPPPFPDLPFMDLPATQRSVTSVEVPTNWVQGVEASMDSSHVGVLHESTTQLTAGGGNQRMLMTKALAPKLEFEERPYGYRYAALRALPDGNTYARVNNFVMPWYGIICPPDEQGPTTVFFSTPVDDVTHRAWFVHYNPHRPLGMTIMSAARRVELSATATGRRQRQLGPEPRHHETRPQDRLPPAPGHRRLRDVPEPGTHRRPHRRATLLGRRRRHPRAPGAAEGRARIHGGQGAHHGPPPRAGLPKDPLGGRGAAHGRRLARHGRRLTRSPSPVRKVHRHLGPPPDRLARACPYPGDNP